MVLQIVRENMKQKKILFPNFSKRRKVIERVFSFLTNLGAERCKSRSPQGFQKRDDFGRRKSSLFSSFCMTKRKIFCPFYFYKMGRWRLRKANRHNPKEIKGESETSPFSSHIVIQERSTLYYNVIACSIYGFIFPILL